MITKSKYIYMNFSADPVIARQNIYNNLLTMQSDITDLLKSPLKPATDRSSLTLTLVDLQSVLAMLKANSDFAHTAEGERLRLLQCCRFGIHSFPSNRRRDRCLICNRKPKRRPK